MSNDDLNDLQLAFYNAFRQVKGVGVDKARACAIAAQNVCDRIVADVDTTESTSDDTSFTKRHKTYIEILKSSPQAFEIPWHMIPRKYKYAFVVPVTGDPEMYIWFTSNKRPRAYDPATEEWPAPDGGRPFHSVEIGCYQGCGSGLNIDMKYMPSWAKHISTPLLVHRPSSK